MTDLIEFLRARLDEDEQVAKAAAEYGGAEWRLDLYDDVDPYSDGVHGLNGSVISSGDVQVKEGRHIARHDPARVLREVAATRRLIAWYVNYMERIESIDYTAEWEPLQFLALPYAGHPDYRDEWRPPYIAGDPVPDDVVRRAREALPPGSVITAEFANDTRRDL